MQIYITRHGQTNLNKKRLMQGRTDEPLNMTGRLQAEAAKALLGGVTFDAVYASPLVRARKTASIIAGIPMKDVIVDDRLIETDFEAYEQCKYYLMGPAMTLYWALPEIFPAPATVESVSSMVERSRSFLEELREKDYERVLIVCHGGIIRALCGVLENRPLGIKWRPKPHNCEMRVYETRHEGWRKLRGR